MLHLYRIGWYNKEAAATIIAYLLEYGHCDPNRAMHGGQTPLDLAREPEHIRLLLKFGAIPNESNIRKCFPEHFENQPANMAIKMFVLGNPGSGKSTLIKSLQTEGTMLSRIKHRFTKVTDVDERTAGIIPYDIESKALGRVILYDFAGHREFYAGHDALLQNSMTAFPSIIVQVIDMRGEEGLIRETLHYWSEFINNHNTEGRFKSHLVILGSHTDCLSSGEKNQKAQFLRHITSQYTFDNISIVGQVMLDCRYAESSSISQLRSILMQSCKELRSSETIAITHRCFLVFLFNKYRDQPAVRFSVAATEMVSSAELYEYAYLRCLKSTNLIEVCEMLNKRGDILIFSSLRIMNIQITAGLCLIRAFSFPKSVESSLPLRDSRSIRISPPALEWCHYRYLLLSFLGLTVT